MDGLKFGFLFLMSEVKFVMLFSFMYVIVYEGMDYQGEKVLYV